MTFVVPYDASPLAETALRRAASFAAVFDHPVVAISVIPEENADYARERGWLDAGDAFDVQSVVATLRERVAAVAPDAEFRYECVGRYAPPGTISNRIRKLARRVEASMVFVGSENAGSVVTSLCSVGSGVATDAAYDVVIVRSEARDGSDDRDEDWDGDEAEKREGGADVCVEGGGGEGHDVPTG